MRYCLRHSPLAIAVLLLINAAYGRWSFAAAGHNIDYFTLWSVPHTLASKAFAGRPVPDIYAAETQRAMGAVLVDEAQSPFGSPQQIRATSITSSLYQGRVDATGTPFAYAVVGTLSSGDFAVDVGRFHWASLLSLIVAICLLCQVLRYPPVNVLMTLAFFMLGFAPVLADDRAANVNQIQLLAVAAFLFLASRAQHLAAGIALGLGLVIKPNLAFVVVTVLLGAAIDGQYRRIMRMSAGLILAMATAIGIGAAYYGRLSLWLDFLRSVPRTLGHGYSLDTGNLGLAQLLASSFNLSVSGLLVPVLLATVAVVWWFSRSSGTDARVVDDAFLAVGAGAGVLLLGSQLAWLHYDTVLIPIAMYLLRPLAEHEDATRERVVGWWCGVLSLALLASPVLELTSPVHQAVQFNLAALLLLIACLYSAWRGRRAVMASTAPVVDEGRRRRAGTPIRAR